MRVSYINLAAEMMIEISHKRILSSKFEALFASVNESLLQELPIILETGHTYTQRECDFVLYNGETLMVDCTVSLIHQGKKNSLIIEMQARDRLQRISREEQLYENHEAAKILIRGLAHEIKNPLGGIRGAAQLLDAELTNAEHHDYTKVIMEESDRLRNLVDRMLGTNKALNLTEINIHEILERVCSLVHAESGGTIKIVKDYDPSIPELKGDKSQLIQGFLNIAKNAMQAMNQQVLDGKEAYLTIRTRTLRQFTIGHHRYRLVVKVELIDNGPGIPKDFLQNIFYPMISGRAEGTGLGLSITQSIFSKHDGLVECESKPGCTNFIVYIPLELKS